VYYIHVYIVCCVVYIIMYYVLPTCICMSSHSIRCCVWSNDIYCFYSYRQALQLLQLQAFLLHPVSHYIDHVSMKHLATHVCSTTVHCTSTVLHILHIYGWQCPTLMHSCRNAWVMMQMAFEISKMALATQYLHFEPHSNHTKQNLTGISLTSKCCIMIVFG